MTGQALTPDAATSDAAAPTHGRGTRSPSQRRALIAWSALAEPGDAVAATVVEHLGAAEALTWLASARHDPLAATHEIAPHLPTEVRAHLIAGIERWARRWDSGLADHERRARAVNAQVLTRTDPGWPHALGDLGITTPFALYVRGDNDLDALWSRSLAVVGARAATAYGCHMADVVVAGAASVGASVISGGAYGIDAAAHRSALAHGTRTVAVMAGGIDRLYPTGNTDLLRQVIEHGAVVAEVPPGFAPHRSRFLSRNRLIGAASATVVVEAALRSGALNTVRHAADLARPVGAVPGPATSASSAGCHEVMREAGAVVVACHEHVVELVVSTPEWSARPHPAQASPSRRDTLDFATAAQRAVYDATSTHPRDMEAIAQQAGLDLASVRTAMGALSARGLIEAHQGGWTRVSRPFRKGA